MLNFSRLYLPNSSFNLKFYLSQKIFKKNSEFHSEKQKQEKRHLSLVENMNDGLLYLDLNNKISFVNDKFCQISGYNRNEIIGNNIDKFSPSLKLIDAGEIDAAAR